ncbi:MAG: S8 family serine peptidase [Phycisphaerales bacterium]|nr:MAG: S8 family serine peptidase [Phycisphaerales bacterium]
MSERETAQLGQEVENARVLRMARDGLAEDAGDFYRVNGRKIRLLRSLEKVAVRSLPGQDFSLMNQFQITEQPEGEFLVEHESSEHGIAVLQLSKLKSLRRLTETVHDLELIPGVVQAAPVYIREDSGLELIPTDQFIVKLAEGTSYAELEAFSEVLGAIVVRPLRGTADQFILFIPGSTPEELLSTCEIYWQDPAFEWAHPNFLSKAIKCAIAPNDTLYSRQWHLNNTGQSGGRHDADIDAPEAWEMTTGSSQVIIAIIDDGMDLTHEDLRDNLAINSLETATNGLDDDNNGYRDDRNGWDFHNNHSEPIHTGSDCHGTLVAGVAAATGNNNRGVAGCAFGCRLMPLKTGEGDWYFPANEAEAIRYAAGLDRTGRPVWRGADVINISSMYGEEDVISSALHDAVTKGRGGKGCPIFCSSGNDPDGWTHYVLGPFSAGTYTFKWEFRRTSSGSPNRGIVWLDTVIFPGGAMERFERNGLPQGWRTGGSSNWTSVQNGYAGNHAMTGWDGQRSRAVRAGSIGSNQNSYLQVEKYVSDGDLEFWYWPLMESGEELRIVVEGDNIQTYVDTIRGEKAEPQDEIGHIGYPASHPDTIAVGASTDFDYRADYSRYGTGIDFVAPSGGGSLGIYSTDRTGSAGEAGDYVADLTGTSAASPLAAGVAALMLSENPNLTAVEVRDIMRDTCDKLDSASVPYVDGRNQYYGYGRVNAGRAVRDVHPTGSLRVTISPQAARDAGARWRRTGTDTWRTSGSTESNVPTGSHAVQFKSISGWDKPPNRTVTVNDGRTATTNGTYVRQTGSLTVTINPQAARDVGARWRRVGTGTWRESDSTERNIPTGSHTVEFKSIAGWNRPSNRTVTVNSGQTTTTIGTYTFDPPTGSLTVTINPQAARDAGARWRRVGTTTWRESGSTETNVPTGSHTVEFKSIWGWTEAANQTVTINSGQTTTTTGTYTFDPPTGSLRVTISPQAAVSAGAKWRRVGTSTWRTSGSTETNVPIGSPTVEFSFVFGWIRPENRTVFIFTGSTTTTTGEYTAVPPPTGSLTVTIEPQAVRDAGARWRRVGTSTWRNSGWTETNIPAGNHTVEFSLLFGFTAPPRQTVTISGGGETKIIGRYVPHTGSLSVTIEPQAARNAGARWRRVGTSTWRTSGSMETNIPTGLYSVEFNTVFGWIKPANRLVFITGGATSSTSGTYIRFAPIPITGSLTVTINPQAARDAGARWRRVGTSTWRTSGSTETNILAGSHEVEFSFVSGWFKPSNRTVSISGGLTTTASGTYIRFAPIPITGSLTVTIYPQGARDAGARWRRVGTSTWRTSGSTETNILAGSHEVEFSFVSGWFKPFNRTVFIPSGQTATTSGTYISIFQ